MVQSRTATLIYPKIMIQITILFFVTHRANPNIDVRRYRTFHAAPSFVDLFGSVFCTIFTIAWETKLSFHLFLLLFLLSWHHQELLVRRVLLLFALNKKRYSVLYLHPHCFGARVLFHGGADCQEIPSQLLI